MSQVNIVTKAERERAEEERSPITIDELNAMTPRQLKDVGYPRLVVSERGSFGVPLCVLVPFEHWQDVVELIRKGNDAAIALWKEIEPYMRPVC